MAGIELEAGGARAFGGSIDYAVSCAMPLEIADGLLRGRAHLTAGQSIVCALETCSFGDTPSLLSEDEIEALLTSTERVWRSWSDQHRAYQGPYQAEVRHSSLVLQALTYAPTGAMVAAPTTSLPEAVGGELNWDYRFCWVRDASVTIQALSVAACRHEAAAFFDFLAAAAGVEDGCSSTTPIMYGIRGERFVPEAEAGDLADTPAHAPSGSATRPGAQRQHDVHGRDPLRRPPRPPGGGGRAVPRTARPDFLVRLADGGRRAGGSASPKPRHLGAAQAKPAPLPPLEADVLGGPPSTARIRPRARGSTPLSASPTGRVEREPDPHGQSSSAAWSEAARRLHAVVRHPTRWTRRRCSCRADRVPRPADDVRMRRHGRRDPASTSRTTTASSTATGPRDDRRARRRARSRCAASGSSGASVHHGDPHAAASALFERLLSRANDVGQFAEEMAADGATPARELPAGLPPRRPDHGRIGARAVTGGAAGCSSLPIRSFAHARAAARS